eukprot:3023735-Pyramimonas_sp.AAC.1
MGGHGRESDSNMSQPLTATPSPLLQEGPKKRKAQAQEGPQEWPKKRSPPTAVTWNLDPSWGPPRAFSGPPQLSHKPAKGIEGVPRRPQYGPRNDPRGG